MRVLTRFGFGEVNAGVFAGGGEVLTVTMENTVDPLGAVQSWPRGEFYAFGDYAVIRVVVVEGLGLPCSNVLPFTTLAEAVAFYKAPSPGGETRFLLNLDTGTFRISRSLGLLVGRYFRMSPWLDRWACEPVRQKDEGGESMDRAGAIRVFNREFEKVAGTSEGLQTEILLDLARNKIVRVVIFAVANRGAVYNKQFD